MWLKYFVGAIFDQFHSYIYGFWLAGIMIAISGSMLFLIPCIQRRQDGNERLRDRNTPYFISSENPHHHGTSSLLSWITSRKTNTKCDHVILHTQTYERLRDQKALLKPMMVDVVACYYFCPWPWPSPLDEFYTSMSYMNVFGRGTLIVGRVGVFGNGFLRVFWNFEVFMICIIPHLFHYPKFSICSVINFDSDLFQDSQ